MSYRRKETEKKLYKKKLKTMKDGTIGGYYFDKELNRIVRYKLNRKKGLKSEVKASNRRMRRNKEISKEGSYAKKVSGDAHFNYL